MLSDGRAKCQFSICSFPASGQLADELAIDVKRKISKTYCELLWLKCFAVSSTLITFWAWIERDGVFVSNISLNFNSCCFLNLSLCSRNKNTHQYTLHIVSLSLYVKCEIILMFNIYFFPPVNIFIVCYQPCSPLNALCCRIESFSTAMANKMVACEIEHFNPYEKVKADSVFLQYTLWWQNFHGFAFASHLFLHKIISIRLIRKFYSKLAAKKTIISQEKKVVSMFFPHF